jgi:hypothetical protein
MTHRALSPRVIQTSELPFTSFRFAETNSLRFVTVCENTRFSIAKKARPHLAFRSTFILKDIHLALRAPATNILLILNGFRELTGGRLTVWWRFRQILGKEFCVQKCSKPPC